MPKINFKSIELNNFMSYSHEVVKLDRSGYVVVRGENNNTVDNAKSNGTGKSSLFSAVSWCLSGETTSGNKNVSNIYSDGETSVTLHFDVDGNEFIITRKKNPSNLFITCNGENVSGKGIRDTEKILTEYLPSINHSLLNSVIILGQGLPQRFSNNTPSGRKEVLEKLSNSDFMIEDIRTRISARKNILDLTLRSSEDKLLTAENNLKWLTEDVNNNEEKLSTYTDEFYKNMLGQFAYYRYEKEEREKALEDADISIKKCTDEKDNAYQRAVKIASEKDSFLKENLLDTHGTLVNLDITQNEIDRIHKIKDVCPTCGQPLKDVEKPSTDLLEVRLEELKKELDYINNENDRIKKYCNEKFDDELNLTNRRVSELNSQEKDLRNNICLHNKELNRLSSEISSLEVKINEFENQKRELAEYISLKRKEIEGLNNNIILIKKEMEDISERIDIVNKMSTMIKREFRGFLLENVVSYINDKAKEYSFEVFGTDRISFEIVGNNITIAYDGKEYESLSGGEKQKIDVIVQLALRDMLCKFLNFSSNILVLDEITDSLDIVGSQKIFNLISSKITDVSAIYIISHHTDFDIPSDDEILIVKGDDRISHIS